MDPISEYVNDVFYLALVTWREARGEPYLGQLAVAYSVMNRVERPAWWGDTVAKVVWKKWQYSSMTDPKDAQLAKLPTPYEAIGWQSWQNCLRAAQVAYNKESPNPAPGADSYYAVSIAAPRWADDKKFVCQIGAHRFYNLDSDHEKDKA
jgi:N-acetylmuramoyl-L-alanine amidase